MSIRMKMYFNVLAVISFIALITYLLDRPKSLNSVRPPIVEGTKTIIEQDGSGNFIVMGTIDNISISMLIDTGASSVVVSEKMAERAGLSSDSQVEIATANGITKGYTAIIKNIQIGNLLGENVEAVIVPNLQISHALIGMSFLKKVNFEKYGSHLILTPQL